MFASLEVDSIFFKSLLIPVFPHRNVANIVLQYDSLLCVFGTLRLLAGEDQLPSNFINSSAVLTWLVASGGTPLCYYALGSM